MVAAVLVGALEPGAKSKHTAEPLMFFMTKQWNTLQWPNQSPYVNLTEQLFSYWRRLTNKQQLNLVVVKAQLRSLLIPICWCPQVELGSSCGWSSIRVRPSWPCSASCRSPLHTFLHKVKKTLTRTSIVKHHRYCTSNTVRKPVWLWSRTKQYTIVVLC